MCAGGEKPPGRAPIPARPSGVVGEKPRDESGHGGFDLPASRTNDPAVQAQGKDHLRRVLDELSEVARHSKASRKAVRIFLALFFDKTSVEDLARVEQVDDNYIHVVVCRLRKHLRKVFPDLAE